MVYQFAMTPDPTHAGDEAVPGALPVYIQIAEVISRQIDAGLLEDGQRLPTERDMAKSHGVAVGTLRKALARLTEMGRLDRRQGSGNYIRQTDRSAALYTMFKLERPDGGGLPTARLLSLATMKKPDELPAFGTGETAHRFRRLRFLDAVPVALEEIWLDAGAAPDLPSDRISDSLYKFYRDVLGLWITRTEDRVSLAPVPDWTVDQFPLYAGTVAGYVERIGWAQDGARVEYSQSWFDPAQARFVARQR
jgi:GntR family transcriptional regulator